MLPIDQWHQYLANNGEIVAIAAGLLGAVIASFVASRFELNNGFRLIAAACGFGALFLVARSTAIGQRGDSRIRDALIEDAMFSRPEFRALADSDATFRQKVRAFLDSLPDDLRLADVREKVVKWTGKETGLGPPPTLSAHVGLVSDTTAGLIPPLALKALYEVRHDSAACIHFIMGLMGSNLPPQLSAGTRREFYQLLVKIGDEAERSPQPRITEQRALPAFEQLNHQLMHYQGIRAPALIELLSSPANARTKPREVCHGMVAMFSAISDMPRPQRGQIMRYMLDKDGRRKRNTPRMDTLQNRVVTSRPSRSDRSRVISVPAP
jgi:uncharacterized membrane protein YeaQ/YmgE (transglycosylase-associated protein family)